MGLTQKESTMTKPATVNKHVEPRDGQTPRRVGYEVTPKHPPKKADQAAPSEPAEIKFFNPSDQVLCGTVHVGPGIRPLKITVQPKETIAVPAHYADAICREHPGFNTGCCPQLRRLP
jgi:hypothetical protein